MWSNSSRRLFGSIHFTTRNKGLASSGPLELNQRRNETFPTNLQRSEALNEFVSKAMDVPQVLINFRNPIKFANSQRHITAYFLA